MIRFTIVNLGILILGLFGVAYAGAVAGEAGGGIVKWIIGAIGGGGVIGGLLGLFRGVKIIKEYREAYQSVLHLLAAVKMFFIRADVKLKADPEFIALRYAFNRALNETADVLELHKLGKPAAYLRGIAKEETNYEAIKARLNKTDPTLIAFNKAMDVMTGKK